MTADAPIAAYWPAFAANGKERIPVRWALSHQAGLAAVDGEPDVLETPITFRIEPRALRVLLPRRAGESKR